MASTTSARSGEPNERPHSANVDDIEAIKAELGRLSSMVSARAETRYAAYREKAESVAQDRTDRGMRMKDEAMARAGAIEEDLQRSVRGRPLTAVAIAAGVGYLIGLLSRSRP